MIDKEMHDYIMMLLKQGYDIDEIKSTLIKAGHEINKVENVSLMVFELFHKDLIEIIDKEIEKGKNIEEIKKDLLKVGHSENKLKQIVKYHKKKVPLNKRFLMNEFWHREKIWFGSWIRVYLILFAVILVIFIILAVSIKVNKNSNFMTSDEKLTLCNSLLKTKNTEDHNYAMLCLSLLGEKNSFCSEIEDEKKKTECEDGYYIYRYYSIKDKKECSKITDNNLKEYCYQLSDKNCNTYFGNYEECQSVVTSNITYCKSIQNSTMPSFFGCKDNYYLYMALQKKTTYCDLIEKNQARKICYVLSR